MDKRMGTFGEGGFSKMEDYTVKSVDKACHLLEVVSRYPQGIAITELATQVDMYKSTVHRLLTTLLRRGYIEQDERTGKYKLGYALLDLGMKLLSSIDLRAEAAVPLRELADFSNEIVHLALLERGEIVYIDKVESDNTTRMHSRIGKRVPVHSTSLGKVILAYLPVSEAREILNQNERIQMTDHTIVQEDELLAEIERVKERGYAFDLEENEIGVCCIAAPIFDHANNVVAACSVSGPSSRMTTERLHAMIPVVIASAKRISNRLGHGVLTEEMRTRV
ncbi:IclR family transcriptional regulator [Ferroacidibacillus organovorans]|nr:IclR family transcriptional regulator [Ferroacidibacillus organovorans]